MVPCSSLIAMWTPSIKEILDRECTCGGQGRGRRNWKARTTWMGVGKFAVDRRYALDNVFRKFVWCMECVINVGSTKILSEAVMTKITILSILQMLVIDIFLCSFIKLCWTKNKPAAQNASSWWGIFYPSRFYFWSCCIIPIIWISPTMCGRSSTMDHTTSPHFRLYFVRWLTL